MRTSKNLPIQILHIIPLVLMIFSMCECNSSKDVQSHRPIKQLAEAQREAQEVSQLLCDDLNLGQDKDIKDIGIARKWQRTYIQYFDQRQKRIETKKEYTQFLENSYNVAVSTILIIMKYEDYTKESNKWYPVLEFRDAVMKTLEALALIRPNLRGELTAAKTDIENIKGGCDSGRCPFVSASYVRAESRKLQRLLTSLYNMLSKVKDRHEQVYSIGKQAAATAKQALQEFEKKTNNFDVTRMEPERKKLFCEFVQSAAMLTIALKELYEDSFPLSAD